MQETEAIDIVLQLLKNRLAARKKKNLTTHEDRIAGMFDNMDIATAIRIVEQERK